jgi:hypothetical protein
MSAFAPAAAALATSQTTKQIEKQNFDNQARGRTEISLERLLEAVKPVVSKTCHLGGVYNSRNSIYGFNPKLAELSKPSVPFPTHAAQNLDPTKTKGSVGSLQRALSFSKDQDTAQSTFYSQRIHTEGSHPLPHETSLLLRHHRIQPFARKFSQKQSEVINKNEERKGPRSSERMLKRHRSLSEKSADKKFIVNISRKQIEDKMKKATNGYKLDRPFLSVRQPNIKILTNESESSKSKLPITSTSNRRVQSPVKKPNQDSPSKSSRSMRRLKSHLSSNRQISSQRNIYPRGSMPYEEGVVLEVEPQLNSPTRDRTSKKSSNSNQSRSPSPTKTHNSPFKRHLSEANVAEELLSPFKHRMTMQSSDLPLPKVKSHIDRDLDQNVVRTNTSKQINESAKLDSVSVKNGKDQLFSYSTSNFKQLSTKKVNNGQAFLLQIPGQTNLNLEVKEETSSPLKKSHDYSFVKPTKFRLFEVHSQGERLLVKVDQQASTSDKLKQTQKGKTRPAPNGFSAQCEDTPQPPLSLHDASSKPTLSSQLKPLYTSPRDSPIGCPSPQSPESPTIKRHSPTVAPSLQMQACLPTEPIDDDSPTPYNMYVISYQIAHCLSQLYSMFCLERQKHSMVETILSLLDRDRFPNNPLQYFLLGKEANEPKPLHELTEQHIFGYGTKSRLIDFSSKLNTINSMDTFKKAARKAVYLGNFVGQDLQTTPQRNSPLRSRLKQNSDFTNMTKTLLLERGKIDLNNLNKFVVITKRYEELCRFHARIHDFLLKVTQGKSKIIETTVKSTLNAMKELKISSCDVTGSNPPYQYSFYQGSNPLKGDVVMLEIISRLQGSRNLLGRIASCEERIGEKIPMATPSKEINKITMQSTDYLQFSNL